MERPTCKTCSYWLLEEHHRGDENLSGVGFLGEISFAQFVDAYGEYEDIVGACKRYPGDAEAKVYPANKDGGYTDSKLAFIVIPHEVEKFADDWCGEHPDFPAYIASLNPLSPHSDRPASAALNPNDEAHTCAAEQDPTL